MQLTSRDLAEGQPIHQRFAFGKPDPDEHMALSDNLSPHLAWDDVPAGTRSFAVLCVDPDVPGDASDVNTDGRTLPADMARVDFYHWLLVDLEPDTYIEEGDYSDGVTPRGKEGPDGPSGTRQGANDYTNWFAEDPEMAGTYFGYDGPCPPWNDSLVHHYHFTLYALDVAEAPVDGEFTGDELVDAIEPHILDRAEVVGLYTLNPDVEI